jgi:hypothetical protein
LLQAAGSRDKNIRFSGFNPLHCSQIQVRPLRQLFLRYPALHSGTPQIPPKFSELKNDFRGILHSGLLCRKMKLTATAQYAAIPPNMTHFSNKHTSHA